MLRQMYAEKPFEFILTILVAIAALSAGVAGYFAGVQATEEASFRGMGLSRLNDANTDALQANQIILRDEQLLIRAEIADLQGDPSLAMELRSRMSSVRLGYLDLSGNATPAYGGDFERARDAFIEDMYAPSRANRTASDVAFANAEIVATKGLRFLLATILFTLAAVLSTVGMGAKTRGLRRSLTILVAIFLVVPITVVVLAAFT
jgi:hypothetical protein